MGKLSKDEAILKAIQLGVDFNKDFHAQSYGNELSSLARESGFRKSKTSSGSLGRAFFYHLEKIYGKNPSYYKGMAKEYSWGGGIAIGGILGGYLGYKVGRMRPQKSGFETEKKVAKAIGKGTKKVAKDMSDARAKRKQKKMATSMAEGGGVDELDYTQIYDILKDKIDDSVDEISAYENVGNATGEEVEGKSRDGFIAFTDGGYESHWFEYINTLSGSGTSLPTKVLDTEMERQVDYNYNLAKEEFIRENEELVEEIGEDKVNYHDLYELGYGSEAEELSEKEREMGDDTIKMTLEAYYYNPQNSRAENNQHTINLIADVNLEAPYHRRGNMDDYKEITFTFNSLDELDKKMDENIPAMLEWFDGSNYDDSDREMRIRKMAKGGQTYTEGGVIVEWYDKDTNYQIKEFDTSQMQDAKNFFYQKKAEFLKPTLKTYDNDIILDSTFAEGGRVRYVLNGFEESLELHYRSW